MTAGHLTWNDERMTRVAASRAATLVAVAVSVVSGVGALALDVAVLTTHPEPPLSSGWSGVIPGVAMLIRRGEHPRRGGRLGRLGRRRPGTGCRRADDPPGATAVVGVGRA
ncbi:hypothetical protein [Microbacterium sp. SLBN-154]|uniref:hypothetical protein n=1 Tax=Microbacterium sp. SLBN-154 TaxID=2768458 RepID=UPI0013586DE9|nr:hypothetical protein [Microbacterium sp. SLBN-154]